MPSDPFLVFWVYLVLVWDLFRLGLAFLKGWFKVKSGFHQGLCERGFRVFIIPLAISSTEWVGLTLV